MNCTAARSPAACRSVKRAAPIRPARPLPCMVERLPVIKQTAAPAAVCSLSARRIRPTRRTSPCTAAQFPTTPKAHPTAVAAAYMWVRSAASPWTAAPSPATRQPPATAAASISTLTPAMFRSPTPRSPATRRPPREIQVMATGAAFIRREG